jgi:hypothetical protein
MQAKNEIYLLYFSHVAKKLLASRTAKGFGSTNDSKAFQKNPQSTVYWF